MSDVACVFCGKTNEFLGFMDGLCLSCGDRMQTMEKVEIMEGFVKACLAMKRIPLDQCGARPFGVSDEWWQGYQSACFAIRDKFKAKGGA